MTKALALALLLASFARAQTPWNFDAVLQPSNTVVVADILNSAATPEGAAIHQTAEIRVVRVLQGDLAAGAQLALAWQIPASTSSPITAKGALFFLQKQRETYQPLQCADGVNLTDRYMMSARKTAPSGSLAYTEETPLESKIAREEASVFESLALNHEDLLAKDRAARRQLVAIAQYFRFFSPAAVAEIYRDFAESPNVYLRTFGLEGEVQTGEPDAFIALEADANRLAPAFVLFPLSGIAMSLEPRAHLAAAHALARLALNETDFGHLDGLAAGVLGRSGSLEMLPYLAVMLRSPNPSVVDGAVHGFCQLLTSAGPAAAHCPNPSPPNDPAQSQANQRFWLDWWSSHRDEIARTTPLPSVQIPARYNAAPHEAIPQAALPQQHDSLALRFGRLLNSPTEPGFDSPQDRETFANVKLTARGHIERHMSEDRQRIAQSRKDHIPLEPGSLEAGYEHLLETELAACRSRLSSTGWLTLEQVLTKNPTGFGPGSMPGVVFGTATIPAH